MFLKKINIRTISVYTSSAMVICTQADNVILAIPPGLQQKITHDPPLPAARNQLIQRAPMGCVIKIHVYYNKPWWKEAGMCPSYKLLKMKW